MWKIESEQQSGSPSILDIFSYDYSSQFDKLSAASPSILDIFSYPYQQQR